MTELWKVGGTPVDGMRTVVDQDGVTAAYVLSGINQTAEERAEIIAAAPKMFRLLQRVAKATPASLDKIAKSAYNIMEKINTQERETNEAPVTAPLYGDSTAD